MKLPITSITPFTLQDYPDHTACILWFSGCNMACGYCHNPDLVKGAYQKISEEKILKFLESRTGLLDAIVLSGGECTMCKSLPEFTKHLKQLGFKVKIDTNGTNPELLEKLISEQTIDYVALDFKAPETKFYEITKFANYNLFLKSLKLLCESEINLEVRTTIHTHLLNEDDINEIIKTLNDYNYKGIYYLQNFREGGTLEKLTTPSRKFNTNEIKNTLVELEFRGF